MTETFINNTLYSKQNIDKVTGLVEQYVLTSANKSKCASHTLKRRIGVYFLKTRSRYSERFYNVREKNKIQDI